MNLWTVICPLPFPSLSPLILYSGTAIHFSLFHLTHSLTHSLNPFSVFSFLPSFLLSLLESSKQSTRNIITPFFCIVLNFFPWPFSSLSSSSSSSSLSTITNHVNSVLSFAIIKVIFSTKKAFAIFNKSIFFTFRLSSHVLCTAMEILFFMLVAAKFLKLLPCSSDNR